MYWDRFQVARPCGLALHGRFGSAWMNVPVHDCYYLLIGCALFYNQISKAVLTAIRFFVILPFHMDTIILHALVLLILIRVLPNIVKAFPWEELAIFALLFFLVFGSMLYGAFANHDTSLSKTIGLEALSSSIPMYILFRFAANNSDIIKIIGPFAIVSTIAMIFNTAVNWGTLSSGYSQYYGYMSLTSFVVCFVSLFCDQSKGGKFIYGSFSVVGLVLVFMAGARGPFFVAILFIAAMLFLCLPFSNSKKLLVTVFGAICISVIYAFRREIAEFAYQYIIENFGIGNRILAKYITTGSAFTSQGRDIIYPIVYRLIAESPFLGYGTGCDRCAIAAELGASEPYGYYPHNFFLEIIMQFGIPMGFILSICLIALLICAFRASAQFARKWLLSLIFLGILPLMFSGSYLGTPLFFACISVSVAILRHRELT